MLRLNKCIFAIWASLSLCFLIRNEAVAQCNRGNLNYNISTPRCIGGVINFTNNTPNLGDDVFVVEINGNNVGNSFTPTIAGELNITFRRENNEGTCINEYTETITVSELPNANFNFDNANVCSQEAVNFTPTQTGQTYFWEFGDGGISREASPSHVFAAFGEDEQSFTVKLTVTNAAGCSTTESREVTVRQRPNPRLVDEFFAEINSFDNCENASNGIFVFDVELSDNTRETVTNYKVDWGDGSDGFEGVTLPNTHTYNEQGVFQITIEATGVNGCVGTRVFNVYNIGNPALGLSSPGNTTGQCGPVEFQFEVTGFSSNDVTTVYNVDLGDGSEPYILTHEQLVANPFIVHEYNSSACDNFDDGFILRVVAENGCGNTEATVGPISVNLPPEPGLQAPNVGCVGEAVTFIDNTIQGYASGCQRATAFSWNFGDGATLDRGPEPLDVSHIYDTPGIYTITLSTTNQCGEREITHTIEIIEPPVSSFTGGDDTSILSNTDSLNITELQITNNCLPLSLDLQNLSTGEFITEYQWSVIGINSGYQFGNNGGIETNVPNPTINFTESGTYTIALKTTNPCGFSQSYANVVVKNPPQINEVNILGFETSFELNGAIQQACAPVTLDLSTNLNITPGIIDDLKWDVVGINGTPNPEVPTSSTTNDPGAIDLSVGSYIIRLTASNNCGEVTAEQEVLIQAPPSSKIGGSQTVCEGSNFILGAANPEQGINYTWRSLTPGVMIEDTNQLNTTATIEQAGVYELELTASGASGCEIIETIDIIVNPSPLPQINDLPIETCALSNFTITASNDNAANILEYRWEANNNGGLTNAIFSVNDQISTELKFPDLQSDTDVTYQISLTLVSDNACERTITEEIVLRGRPQANFNIPVAVCGSELTPTNTSSFASGYNWQVTGGNNDATVNDANLATPIINFPPNVSGEAVTYTLTLTAGNENGCTDMISKDFNVFPQPAIGFDVGVAQGCEPLEVNFTNTSNFGNGNDISSVSFQWLVNGSLEANSQNFSFSFPNDTPRDLNYEISLVATTPDGCIDSLNQQITVFPNPIAELNPTNIASCAPFIIDRTVIGPVEYPQANDTYTWNFYNTNRDLLRTETGLNFSDYVIGTENDSVIIELVTTNVHGCQEAQTEQLFITIPDPIAGFTFPEAIGCHPFSVPFTNSSTVGITNFEWYINGELKSEEENPIMILENEGTIDILDYTVELIITAGTGCKDTVSSVLQVKKLPEFTLQGAEFCPQDAAGQLSFTSDKQGQITWYANELPMGALTADGIFDPVIAGVNGNGFMVYADFVEDGEEPICTITDSVLIFVHPLPEPDFEAEGFYCAGDLITFNNITTNIPGYSISYNWDFGGVGATTERNGSFTFNNDTDTVIVTLAATTNKGCVTSIEKPIFITEPPVAGFSRIFNPTDTCGTLTTEFTDKSQFVWGYAWDFGTGETASEANPIAFFEPSLKQDTTYYIVQTVSNGCGTDSFTDSIKVKAFPDAEFLFSRDTICADAPLQFNNFSVGNPTLYVWDFGDGSQRDTIPHDPSDNQAPIFHEFIYTGDTDTTYQVTLYAINDCGIDSLSKPIVIIPNLVSALFETEGGLKGCAPHTVTFSTVEFTSIKLNGANTLVWDFGQTGDTRIGGTVHTITYKKPGDYIVQLLVENDCHSDVFTDTIRVFPNADPKFELVNDEICLGDSALILHTSLDPIGSQWNFGNGETFEGINPEPIFYSNTGTYEISLTETFVGENQTCDATMTKQVVVVPLPEANFSMSQIDVCQSEPEPITNLSLGAQSYLWEISNDKGVVYSSSIEPNPQIEFNQAGINTLTLFAFTKENQQGCINAISQTVNVLPKPILQPLVELSREVDCGIWTIEFENRIPFPQDNTEGSIRIDFRNGQVLDGFKDTYTQQFIAPITGEHQVDVLITGITSEGCRDTLVQTLEFNGCCLPKIYLPENNNSFAFTPFNGGINELFQVKHEFVERFEMEIYNREGQMVFKTDDKDTGWNGTYEGQKCDSGLYQVLIRYAGCQSGRDISAEPINIQLFLMD